MTALYALGAQRGLNSRRADSSAADVVVLLCPRVCSFAWYLELLCPSVDRALSVQYKTVFACGELQLAY